jgi:ABC-2 type transport system ATP-binding protein
MTDALTVSNLTKKYDTITAVNDVSFSVKVGDVLGFLGPNGAGKSTTMKMITGFLQPDAGEVVVLGKSMHKQPLLAKAAIGYLPEGSPLYGDMTVINFLGFMAQMRGITEIKKKGAAINRAVSRMQLQSVLRQPIDTLSKGFKRRVGFAQAILHNPKVLILDEPTDGLDPNQKHQIRQLIRDMAKEKAIVISTHILEEVEAICTRAIILNQGKIVLDSTPQQMQLEAQEQRHVIVHVPRAQSDKLLPTLLKIKGIIKVEFQQADDPTQAALRIHGEKDLALLDTVHKVLSDHQLQASQIRMETARVEDMFRKVTLGTMN